MAYTLADFQKTAKDNLKKGVVDVFRRESDVMDLLSFENAGTLSVKLMRMKTLPTITPRNIGETYTESKGITEPLEETVCLLGAYIDIPKELLEDKSSLVDQRALQTKMFTRSLAYKFNDMFINGDPTTNPKEMAGLWYRLTNDISGQAIDAAGIDVSPDSSTLSASQSKLIRGIDELIHACDAHNCDALFMNSAMYLALMATIREKGLWACTKDSFGLDVPQFGPGGPRIYDIGYKADMTSLIIGNVEDGDGALTGGSATSIYAVKFGDEYLNGWQFKDIDVTDIGLLENGVSFRTIIDWGVGLYFYNPRSIARLYDIVAA